MHVFATSAGELGVDPALRLATTYRRQVHASIERIWENVFDWEHLPVLHESYFNKVQLLQSDDHGWQVQLTRQPGDPSRTQTLELQVDREHTRYRVRTLAGTGTGTQIWTLLKVLAAHETAIEVRYYLPEEQPDKVAALGDKYRCSCHVLWNEDEVMMQQRERMLNAPYPLAASPTPPAPADLGLIEEVRQRLPLLVEFGGQSFRIVAVEGELLAHATICPHWLGPLDAGPVDDFGCVRCPWHGYTFDVRTGQSVDGRGLRLSTAPQVHVDAVSGRVTLRAQSQPPTREARPTLHSSG
jgi:nitrite reductase/ring-hydroxylating ferredoxin subunit